MLCNHLHWNVLSFVLQVSSCGKIYISFHRRSEFSTSQEICFPSSWDIEDNFHPEKLFIVSLIVYQSSCLIYHSLQRVLQYGKCFSERSIVLLTVVLYYKFSSNALSNFIKRYNVRKNMQIFYDISNLLKTFQMSYIYYQVIILACKISIKNICIINTPYRNKTIIISQLNM